MECHYNDSVELLTIHYVVITCSITIQHTKHLISELLEVKEEKRKAGQPSSKEDTDDSADETQGNCILIAYDHVSSHMNSCMELCNSFDNFMLKWLYKFHCMEL